MKINKAGALTLTLLVGLLSQPVFSAGQGAERHAKAGVVCEACHGPDKAKPAVPELKTCAACHDVDAIVAKTEKVKPANPHVSPHYGKELECTNCHSMHGESTDYCTQCHNFGFKVP